MMLAVNLFLRQNGTVCIVRSVSFHAKHPFRIGMNKDGSLTDLPFKDFEGGLLVLSPILFVVLLKQGMEGPHYVREPWNPSTDRN
jgi:hypothetical protein